MSKTYRLTVTRGETALVDVDGSLDVVAYAARKDVDFAAGSEEEFAIDFVETEGISDSETRTVLKMTADGEIVAFFLAKKLRQERSAVKDVTPDGAEYLIGDQPASV